MDINITVIVMPTSETISLELHPDTSIQEIKEYLVCYLFQNFEQNGWCCYSNSKGLYLEQNEKVENYSHDTLVFDYIKNIQYTGRSSMSDIEEYDYPKVNDQLLNSQQKNKNNDQDIMIIVEFLDKQLELEIEQNVKIQEIINEIINFYNQNGKSLNIGNDIHQLVCYSTKRNCLLQFDEIVGPYPNDILKFKIQQSQSSNVFQDNIQNPQQIQIRFKVDQKDIEVMEIKNTIKIKDLLSQIKNNQAIQGDYNQWTCYSEMRNCYLNLDQKVGNYPNDKLLIATQHQMKCEYFSGWLEQTINQIKDKFKQIKEIFLDGLISKEKEMIGLFNDFRAIFQLAFLQDTHTNTLKLHEFILRKNEDYTQIQNKISQLQLLTKQWKLNFNEIGIVQRKKYPCCTLSVEKQETGVVLLQYLKENFSDFINKNELEINEGAYSLKYLKKIDLQKEVGQEIQDDDIIAIGPFYAEIRPSNKDEFDMEIRSLQ